MRISQLADAAETTPRTVRHYHRLGLMKEPPRLPNGYREYRLDDLIRLMRIRWLADAGVPLGSVESVLSVSVGREDKSDAVADLTALIAGIEAEQAKLAARHARLVVMLERAESGTELSALPADLAEALDSAIDNSTDSGLAASLRRERDMLELLAISGRAPDDLLSSYVSMLADDTRRSSYLTAMSEWTRLEGRDPASAEVEIDHVAQSLISLYPDGFAGAPEDSSDNRPAMTLEDIIEDPAQREVVARVQRRWTAVPHEDR
ncbi:MULTISPECIES: MerR family transcriptional regulator [unclassified Rhodococcus (in: high G+C Gram-positive bacteria)]|uniref:MerR family transcriptional regulator n=1 Tax=unclassified Rhodococcus (in: high G+C Gram-positive bacteria) TaxID=192944 RepID=UPI001FFBEDA5|nr:MULTISPECIES: MerR family transcriptional regulator [unclassified Rhodococcus (in: high G+C Gram-positive bacteria)]